jgi:TM2 domain-containing membrane protein YozV
MGETRLYAGGSRRLAGMPANAVSRPLPAPSHPLRPQLPERRSLAVAYLLWALGFFGVPFGFPGLHGIHRFYCRKPLSGSLWLISFGLLGIGQLVDLLLIPRMVEEANLPWRLQQAEAAAEARATPSLEYQLLDLARRRGTEGFTINDALLALQLPHGVNSDGLRAEIQRLLQSDLLDVGNDARGRLIYREP